MQRIACDALVLGGGAAGLFCAAEAGKRGRRVTVLEGAAEVGKKILISGGGRCNFTNLHCRPESFLSANPHFAKSALARYTPADFIALVERHGIAYHEKTLGQLFCDGSARQVVEMLVNECAAAGVEICTKAEVRAVRREQEFIVETGDFSYSAPALVVATGGLSIPKVGATDIGYRIASQFGLRIRECRPALVPLLFDADQCRRWCDLAGVSLEAAAECAGRSFQEKMLITHRGLSGPAVLQISSYWSAGDAVDFDLLPGRRLDLTSLPARRLDTVRAALRENLSKRFADRWVEMHAPASFGNRGLEAFERSLHSWKVVPAGTEGYEKAEVTAGGVDVDELSAKTMECRRVPGLYFIGEVADVTGHLGGFNFQWAWASGFCAGNAI